MHQALVAAATVALALTASPGAASAIPAFARRYAVSCSLCHAPAPRLTPYGETFAGNGFEMSPGEEPADTIDTGDATLRLLERLPLAVRLDVYAQVLGNARTAEVAADLQTPWAMKLLSGGPIADGISYYAYFFLGERGEVAGLEDAYLQFTDIGGTGVSLLVGQFQVSDPLFKRELRLEYEDYHAYRVRVGAARADLTYDRGVMLVASPWEGGDLSLQVVNGTGLEPADASRQYDGDAWKNGALRLSQEFGPARFGGFLYYGIEEQAAENRILVWGPDVTIGWRDLELNLQYLRRSDDDPFFVGLDDAGTTVDAAFAELLWFPAGQDGRTVFSVLYNVVRSDDAVFTLRLGESAPLSSYRSLALGANRLLFRNIRLTAEAAWKVEPEQVRLTAGVVTAF